MAGDPEIFDPTALTELIALEADDPHLVRDLIRDYLDKSAELINRLNISGDQGAIEHAAHTLKSSSALLGLRSTAGHAGALEEAARNGTAHARLVSETETAWRAGCAALVAYIKKS